MSSNTILTDSLKAHKNRLGEGSIMDLFQRNPKRFDEFSTSCGELFLDYSKNFIDEASLKELIELAETRELHAKTEAMFRGDVINSTEYRAVLHTALRNGGSELDTETSALINSTKARMLELAGHVLREQGGYARKP